MIRDFRSLSFEFFSFEEAVGWVGVVKRKLERERERERSNKRHYGRVTRSSLI